MQQAQEMLKKQTEAFTSAVADMKQFMTIHSRGEATAETPKSASTNAIPSDINEVTLQSIERALAHENAADYTFMPGNAEVNTLFSRPESPPIYKIPNDNRPYVCIRVNGRECMPLLDSGSMVCIIVYQHDRELQPFQGKIEPCDTRISTICKEGTQCTGQMQLEYTMCGRKRTISTLLFKSSKSQFIVGINFWQAFGIRLVWDQEQPSTSQTLATNDQLNVDMKQPQAVATIETRSLQNEDEMSLDKLLQKAVDEMIHSRNELPQAASQPVSKKRVRHSKNTAPKMYRESNPVQQHVGHEFMDTNRADGTLPSDEPMVGDIHDRKRAWYRKTRRAMKMGEPPPIRNKRARIAFSDVQQK